MSKPNNIAELRNDLLDVFDSLKSDTIDVSKAKELSNTAGKVIKSLSVQLAYNQYMGHLTKIDFLEPKL